MATALSVAQVVNRTGFVTGQVVVAAAGTPVQGPNVAVPDGIPIAILAFPGNGGLIYIGNSLAEVLAAGARWDGIGAGGGVTLNIRNLNAVWFDAVNNGEGVSYMVER